MAIRRACSYAATITTPEAPATYSAILVSFSQDQRIVHSFELGDPEIVVGDDAVTVQLTQEQTAAFAPSQGSPMGRENAQPAYLQIRCYKSAYEAPGSKTWAIEVYDSLETEVLS